tara:strand:- start:368 stop:1252 length:885 start_codon:yes stop_codon:yes gene_type:complete
MPELQTMESPKTAGFVNPNHNNRNRDRIEQEEKELEELEGKTKEAASEEEESIEEEQTDTEDKEKTLSGEEKSFKKRYGDLRRHLNDKESEWKDKFESLEKRLDKENIIPPKSDEDIDEWARQYPDVAGIVETIAAKKAQEMFSKAESRLQKLDEEKEQVTRDKAEDSIRKAHSDFDKLREEDGFHDWVNDQPKWVQNALYENSDDADSVIRVIDLYKIDNGLTKSDYAAKRKAAAKGVKKGTKTQLDAEEANGSIKESDVAKMSMQDFELQQDAITKAMRSGKFIYDLSGNAR